MIPFLMSGGSGQRLWPFSRKFYPKQFCDLFAEPMIISTAKRVSPFGHPVVVSNQNLKALTEKTFARFDIPLRDALWEPQSKNTAAAAALIIKYAFDHDCQNEVLGIFPCDHSFTSDVDFQAIARAAEKNVVDTQTTTIIGIEPTHPVTGYGYIHLTSPKSQIVESFEEKPTLARAVELQAQGCLWNSGIVITTGALLKQIFEEFQPELWSKFENSNGHLEKIYAKLLDLSFDVAILEKLGGGKRLSCLQFSGGWSDVGSWDSYVAHPQSKHAQTFEKNTKNSVVISQLNKTYALIGIDDVHVVDTADACLLIKKGQTESLKEVVSKIEKQNSPVVDFPVNDVRPWGRYSVLSDEGVKVKKVEVDAGARLSYQSHEKRSEHWIVIEGTGVVTLNGVDRKVQKGDYIFIVAGTKHRIANDGTKPLQFIEVQMGSYLGEDDITRYEDDYLRTYHS